MEHKGLKHSFIFFFKKNLLLPCKQQTFFNKWDVYDWKGQTVCKLVYDVGFLVWRIWPLEMTFPKRNFERWMDMMQYNYKHLNKHLHMHTSWKYSTKGSPQILPDSHHISTLGRTYTHTSEAICVVIILMQGYCLRVTANLHCHHDMNERNNPLFFWLVLV